MTHNSAEHAFQYAKAIRCDDLDAATMVQNAKEVLSAKRFGDKIRPNEQCMVSSPCIDTREKVMTEIIENKCKQVLMFREKLRSVKKDTINFESTFNLDKQGIEHTKMESWPGQNILVKIISKVCKKKIENVKKKVASGANQNKNNIPK